MPPLLNHDEAEILGQPEGVAGRGAADTGYGCNPVHEPGAGAAALTFPRDNG